MASFNKVILMPEISPAIPNCATRPRARPSRASAWRSTAWKSEAGEMKEEVTFVDVDAFGRKTAPKPSANT
jgi:hypothetical protein